MKKKKEDNSENVAQVNENEQQEVNEQVDSEENTSETDVKDLALEWEEKYNELNNKYLRLYSEFDNYRKRTQKEKLELYKTAGEDIMLALLPVIDDFERAEKSMQEIQDSKSIKEGIDLIYKKFTGTLENKGLKPMESAVGKEFDLELHEAITKIKSPTDDMKGKVIDEVERGYMLNSKVIRFCKVVVGE